MPARTKLTPEIETKIVTVVSQGCDNEAAAAAAGIPLRTLYRWLARGRKASSGRYKDFAFNVDRARQQVQIVCAAVWKKAAQKDWRAARALLRTRFPEQWSDHKKVDVNAKVEHSGGVRICLPPEKDDDGDV
jgi:hypothetical protein